MMLQISDISFLFKYEKIKSLTKKNEILKKISGDFHFFESEKILAHMNRNKNYRNIMFFVNSIRYTMGKT